MFGGDGVKRDPLKELAIKEFLRLQTNKNIKQFLDLARYYSLYQIFVKSLNL